MDRNRHDSGHSEPGSTFLQDSCNKKKFESPAPAWGICSPTALESEADKASLSGKNGLGAVFPNVEVRHLHAVIVLAEELNFTRAAHRLHITQPALSKQLSELEELHRFVCLVETSTGRGRATHRRRTHFCAGSSLGSLHAERAFIWLAQPTRDATGYS